MILCKRCIMPATRPDTPFYDGICAACISYEKRKDIDWAERKEHLHALLGRHKGRKPYDCIVPSSGGKDSTYQVLTMLEMGMNPLVVTARTCHLTAIGRANIDNLARYAPTLEVVPNMTIRAKLNVLGTKLVGDISWPEHVSIFTTPFRVAAMTGIKLIMYGENPQDQYGGPDGADQAAQMTARWRSEYGGFLGLRPSDLVSALYVTERDMVDYALPPEEQLKGVEAHFLGHYIPWDSWRNARKAGEAGMVCQRPHPSAYWPWENLDNAQTGIHDWQGFLKYGYTRGQAQISVDIRAGLLDRDAGFDAMRDLVRKGSGSLPDSYAGEPREWVCCRIGTTREQLMIDSERFVNQDLFEGPTGRHLKGRPWA